MSVSATSRPAWDDDPVVSGWPGLPALERESTADVCVVGLGGSGLAAVADLVDRGLDVVGIDAGRIAAGAAGRNGGFLLGGPATFLHTALATWGPCAVDLYRATLAEIDSLEEILGSAVVRRTGSIRLAGVPGAPVELSDSEDCDALAQCLRENDIAVDQYSGELGRGIFLPDDAVMNPARRALGLASILAGRARLYENTPATAIGPGAVTTPSGVIRCGLVLVAVDGRLEQVLPQLDGRVRTARLQMLATSPVTPRRLSCPVYGRWGYDYAQQDASGRLYVGGGRDLFVDDEWTPSDVPTAQVQDYIESVATSFAGESVSVVARWAASVGFTSDGRPLCTVVDDTVVAFGGYNGTGNLVGPVTARAAVALGLDGIAVPQYLSS
ncbi:FAD-dependent oxidoreductase [Rhodococcus sp. IEGM 1370]|uniref:NAD(P)/FAD-dependent oxidoreductase n=1 Tax=Rhodococcus sp. IEGM 1370 TaxID=3082222 RepID=UPI002954FB82|nr:FAD-dependent oxidoreductase [Rhodococcus sp. IEGM 1370]MDV8077633.1 FAD-dependent oxidoreductase [Rhodococcus sp. IEGM 1370]